MKKISLLYLVALLPLLFGSCDYTDDSELPNGVLPTIEISGFEENGYSVVSYQGNHLQISPVITTGYNDSQLTYNWYLVDDKASDQAYYNYVSTKKDYTWKLISNEKNLDYEVNLAPGNYHICLDVVADNGYTASYNTTLQTSTNFTIGYYILKQTAEGNTEFDVFRPDDDELSENLFEATTGAALAGTPYALSMANDHAYVDEETNMQAGDKIVTITTKEGSIRCLRTSDLKCVLNNDNILYGGSLQAPDYPYMIISGMWSNIFLSGDGVRSQYVASMQPGTGKYGVAGGGGASRFAVLDTWMYYDDLNTICWNGNTHSIFFVDYNGGSNPIDDMPGCQVNNLTGWDCIACGWSSPAGGALFLLQNTSTGARQLIKLASMGFSGAMPTEAVTLNSNLHLAKGNVFTVSNRSASFFYTVDNNHIYGYDINTGEEQEITAQGIGNETITYISDKWIGSTDTDYFVVGTQNGNQYTLRFYKQLGGKPDGAPLYTTTGTGKVVSVKYTSLSSSSMAIQD